MPADLAERPPRIWLGGADQPGYVVLVRTGREKSEVVVSEVLAEVVRMREQPEVLFLEAEIEDAAVIRTYSSVDWRVSDNPVAVRIEPVTRPADVVVGAARKGVEILFAYNARRHQSDVGASNVSLQSPDGIQR